MLLLLLCHLLSLLSCHLFTTPQVFLTTLNRARQMQQLSPPQLPRGGFWSLLPGNNLRQLETWCLHLSTAAVPLTPSSLNAPTSSVVTGSTTAPATVSGTLQRSSHGTMPSMASSSTGSSMSAGRPAQASSASSGRRRAGSAVPGSVTVGLNAAVDGAQAAALAYDEDGLRWVGPGPVDSIECGLGMPQIYYLIW